MLSRLKRWLSSAPLSLAEQIKERECRDLVLRARAGDQIAMAFIIEITKNAKAGDPNALDSYRRIDRFTKRTRPLEF